MVRTGPEVPHAISHHLPPDRLRRAAACTQQPSRRPYALARPLATQRKRPMSATAGPEQAAAAGGARQRWTGRGPAELAQWLTRSGVDVARYGQASAKSLEQLW